MHDTSTDEAVPSNKACLDTCRDPLHSKELSVSTVLASSRPSAKPEQLPSDEVLSMDEIDTAIVGTTRLDHGLRNIEVAAKGPLPAEVVADLRRQFSEHGGAWEQLG